VVVLAFAGPVAQLTWWAVREQRSDRGTPLLDQYPTYLWNSLQLVAASVAVCMVLAILLANATRFGDRRITRAAGRAVTVGYAVPGPVVGVGVLLFTVAVDAVLERFGWGLPGVMATGSIAVLVYAYAVRFLAPGVGAVESGLAHVPDEMTASARVLGAGPARTTWRVHLPLSGAALLTAAVLVGVDALKELPIVLLLRPFGFDTLPVWVHGMASESRFQQAALPALSIVLVALVPVMLLSRRLERSS
jgi:iron(III) transport system permease protein